MAAATVTPESQDPPKPKKFAKTREWAKGADPFFWLVLLSLVPAVLVAGQVSPERPSWALRSAAVYRLEVGLVIFLGSYLVALALANAYKGDALGRVAFPGGGEVDPKDPALQEASEGAAEFEEETRGGLRDLAEAVSLMNGRVSALEDRQLGQRLTALEDRQDLRAGKTETGGDTGVR